jgi:Fe-S oxidoreductase
MNPVLMALIIVSLSGAFAWSARRRWHLLRVGDATWESRTDRIGERLKAVWTFAFYQKKMRNYLAAGLAHQLIFVGFMVLLLRTLILWGRGFDPRFNLFILGHEPVLGLPLGDIYSSIKDVLAVLVIVGASVFVYFRAIKREKRMTLSGEGLLILGIIMTMMLADLLYDGCGIALRERFGNGVCDADAAWCARVGTLVAPLGAAQGAGYHPFPDPAGSLVAVLVSGLSVPVLVVLAHAGFWTHSTLVLVFLNILPYSKHFHIITAIPNVFLGDLTPRGRLRPLAADTEKLMAAVEKATEGEDLLAARIGYARIHHFSWKDVLDFYTCTECGRCSDNCPAFKTGKLLSPKQFTLDLRDHLYSREGELETEKKLKPVDLVPEIIHPDVLWACTSCRACEEQCPVNITYVDKIVQMRRNLVVIKGEFPQELAKPFEGMESNGNPWNLARVDRTNWADGLGLKMFSEKPDAEVLFWVGCAASYDDRAKKIARATALLLLSAGVDFAILGEEETCTGDPARRAGNEYLFTMLAETNAATLNGYKNQGGIKKILTTCPHCFNTLANEYPDFGAKFEVIHHTDYMLGLVAEKKLVPKVPVKGKVAYHDSCYLGRYNDIYESPRQILEAIPGVQLVEVEGWNRKKGLCCGAGGAQMFMEEQNKDRMNVKRTLQLVDALGAPTNRGNAHGHGPDTIASACPFCMTMLKDGVKAQSKEDEIQNLDVVELLAQSCGVREPSPSAGDAASPAA